MASERLVYMRITRGLPTEAAQRAALRAVGITDAEMDEATTLWIDRGKPRPGQQQNRDLIFGAMREGDEIHVSRLGVLGSSFDEIIAWVQRASELGAVVCDAATGQRFHIEPECKGAADSAIRLIQAAWRDQRAATLEKARAHRKTPAGRPAALEGERREAARVHWFNHEISGDEAAARAGVSKRTLHRAFGKRETPAFGSALNRMRGRDKP